MLWARELRYGAPQILNTYLPCVESQLANGREDEAVSLTAQMILRLEKREKLC